MNTYIDCFDYVNGTTGIEWQSLVGNMARFTSSQLAGASTLVVPATGRNAVSTELQFYDPLVIFDGSSSEIVRVGSMGAAVGSSSIPLATPLSYAHGAGAAWCSPGMTSGGTPTGSLGERIVDACSWFESATAQPLLYSTWTNELLSLGTIRASIDEDGYLVFRPRRWPINQLTGLAITTFPNTTITYNVSDIFLDSDRQIITAELIPVPGPQGQAPYPWFTTPSRNQKGQVIISYTSGYQYTSLPGDIKEAIILITSDMAGQRYNPIGAAEVDAGGTRLVTALRGDLTGESELIKKVMKTVNKYSQQAF